MEEVKYPTVVGINVQWSTRTKSYIKTVNSDRHLDNICNYYEQNGGKVIGVYFKDKVSKK